MKKKTLLMCLLSVTLCSCSKFLDIKPDDKTIPDTPEDFSAIIHEMCDEIEQRNSSSVGARYTIEVAVVHSQECWCDNLETNLTEYPTGRFLDYYVGGPCSNGNVYRRCYSTIARCNIVIDNLDTDTDTQEAKDILGTAYALRGIAYYQLLRYYCPPVGSADDQDGVPLVTEFDMEDRPLRSTIDETAAQAESDMKQAIGYHIQNELYFFNDDVMKGYLARLYFWSRRYKEAKEMALDVLSRHPLLQGDDYVKMMSAYDGMEGNMLFRVGRLDKDYTTLNTYLAARPVSIRYIRLFKEGDKDIRYNLFIGKKRKNKKIFFSGLRSAELALIAMESACHLNENQEALDLLNDFRQHRIQDCVPYTLATLPAVDSGDIIQEDSEGKPLTPLLYAILCERRKELYLEGDRFTELKRNGRPEFWVTYNGLKYYTRKFMYTWALPPADIQLYPALKQNPGYTEIEH